MRYANVIAMLGAALVLGCASTNPYASTASDVFRSSHSWFPAGNDGPLQLSAGEDARLSADLTACTSELSAWLAHANQSSPVLRPSRLERVLQLVSCMETKGWRLGRDEIVVTSGA
jgi:hypothetical protein